MSVVQSTLRISLLEDVVAKAQPIFRTLDRLQRQQIEAFAPMQGLIGKAVALGAGYFSATQGISATAGAAIQFETAFADVKKVVEATDEQFENMRRSIRRMSGEMPLAATDIAALFAAAGESGIATADLQSFAEMAARVGIAFDMTAADAGESLAKLKTQLGLTVAETGEMADAINHLSNNMASKAKDVTEFMLRVGSFGEIAGFAKEDVAAMGSAMIAAGADASTAGTAMKNVIRSLTKGEFANKSQRDAAKALGLHLPTIAKDMQKDAKGTMRKVLKAISEAPKHQQNSLLSEFFGDEASAFMPLVGNIKLLDDALGAVGDRTKYAGSAFKEYIDRANTTGNVLELLGNKVSNVFADVGDDMLPTIREAAKGMGDVIDTLGSRVTIFDQVKESMKGLAQGLGYDGGAREMINDLGDLLLGPVDPNAADRLGGVFMQAKEWGVSIRELNDAIKDNPVAKFFGEISGYGFDLLMYGAGIGLLAGTVRKLAKALFFLSGVGTLVSVFKALKGLSEYSGLRMPGLPGTPAPPEKGSPPPKRGSGGGSGAGQAKPDAATDGLQSKPGSPQSKPSKVATSSVGMQGALSVVNMASLISNLPTDENGIAKTIREAREWSDGVNTWLEENMGSPRSWFGFDKPTPPSPYRAEAAQAKQDSRSANVFQSFEDRISGGAQATQQPVRIDATSIGEMTTPRGTQDVRVTNQPAPSAPIYATFNITGVSDPKAAADSAMDKLSNLVRSTTESSYSD